MTERSTDFLPEQCDPRIREIVGYWRSLPPTGLGVPARRDFDPLHLSPRLLRYIWMVDLECDPPRFRFRLCGSHIVEALGFDPTGRYYDATFPDFASSDTHEALSRVRDRGEASWRTGGPHLVFPLHQIRLLERVFLPMTSDGRRIDICLAASVYRNHRGQEV